MGSDIARIRTARGGSGRSQAEKAVIGERVLREKLTGRFMVDIAKDIGISTVTAYRYMNAALDRREVAAVEDFRKFANEHLDDIEQQVAGQIELAEHLIRKGGEMVLGGGAEALGAGYTLIERGAKLRDRSIVRRISLAERRAKLNGLDAPVVVQATVVTLSEVDADLAAMVAEAERRMADDPAGRPADEREEATSDGS